MNQDMSPPLSLRLPSLPSLLPVVVPFAENAAAVFGLGREEALGLALATEEIFAYLSQKVCPGEPMEIACRNGVYYVRVQFQFAVSELNLKGLNITSTINMDGETGLEDMGLLLASRAADRLNIDAVKGKRILLTIEKDKAYPPAPEDIRPRPDYGNDVILKMPDPEELKILANSVARTHSRLQRPLFFDYPGKVVDMVASGEYAAIVAVTPRGDIAGGILFYFQSERVIQIFGPFMCSVSGQEKILRMLMDACLAQTARSRALGVMSLTGLPAGVDTYFEPLGELGYYQENGDMFRMHASYRLLHEDPGAAVWTHSDLYGFLEEEYRRLALAREIKVVHDLGETRAGASIFSTELRRDRSDVFLRPLWPGADFAANVETHVRFLKADHIRNIFFSLDLGVPWHGAIMPALLANRFRPGIILPFAGQADIVVFQYHEHGL